MTPVIVIVTVIVIVVMVTVLAMFLMALVIQVSLMLLVALVLQSALTRLVTHVSAFLRTDVARLIFGGPDEINRPVASVVFAAMQAPGARVLRRNVQIDRLRHYHLSRRRLDSDRLGIDQRRSWSSADIHAAVHPRSDLATNRHSDIHIGARGRDTAGQGRQGGATKYIPHGASFAVDRRGGR